MTAKEFFISVFGADVFDAPRTQPRSDRRAAAYTFMRTKMGMTYESIGKEIGRNHSTVMHGVNRFSGLLQNNDPDAIKIWHTILIKSHIILYSNDLLILDH